MHWLFHHISNWNDNSRNGQCSREQGYLIKMISNNLPDSGPLQPYPAHVVVRNLDDLLQAEHSRVGGGEQLIHGYRTEPANEIHC